ncbi:alpha/beta hydrolase [Salinigranum marinum]|uniref:alpha/beta fold hydrolase n=1 Tax=Salinigranum marinum TaxID=1515595 RepID=UPI002989B49F|nr:alpha/beta hydrolase [Salinigranum marinum]
MSDRADTNTVWLDDERRLTYAEYGRAEGIPVVFLHGTPGSRRLGGLLAPVARRAGIRVLAPDRPGYGRSTPWPDWSVADAGAFVTAVLDDTGVETAGLVAFSGGSPYALAAAETLPGRVTRVDVVAGATPPGVGGAVPLMQRALAGMATATPLLLRGLFRGQAWLARRLDPSVVVSQYTTGDATSVPDGVAQLVKADFVEAFARHRSGAVTEFRESTRDWGVDFAAIDQPVHLWHGESDTNVPLAGVRRLEARVPTARLHVLDADHLRTLLRCRSDVLGGHR